MTWLFVIVVILVLGAGFAAALGLLGGLPETEEDLRPDTRDGQPSFDLAIRGYRMDEVDVQLQSMQDEIDALRGEVEPAEANDSPSTAEATESPSTAEANESPSTAEANESPSTVEANESA